MSDEKDDVSTLKFLMTRRGFLQVLGATGALYWLGPKLMLGDKVLAQALPGGSIDPTTILKFQTPMLIPPVMPKAGRISQQGKVIDYYEISVRQFLQQILPAGLPATTVWGYGPVSAANKRAVMLHNTPALTIEASVDTPVRIKWINELVDAQGNFLPHLLPVDPTLHWANPPGGTAGRDMRPTFDTTPGPYTGPVPMVTHVHGAVGVGDESDGYPEAWFLPVAADIPAGYAKQGSWYDFYAGKAKAKFTVDWGPGYAVFQYPNNNRASTIWYHDHTLGMTRLNVYAGTAGFYLLRGKGSNVTDSRDGTLAVLPGPAPQEYDTFPTNKSYYEIPIVIQDRSFNADGSLFYPDSRTFFDQYAGPYIPFTDISPIWNPEFFGNTLMVNGNTWPYQTVEQRRYRFRFLNGCQSRFLILDFANIPGVEVWQIGNEGGYLAAPVNLTAINNNRSLIALAERADLIVDFTNVAVGNYILGNLGPDEPFGGGQPGVDFTPSDPATTGQVLEFRVVPAVAPDPSTPPQFLVLPPVTPLPAETVVRPLVLAEVTSPVNDGPAAALLGPVAGDPNGGPATFNGLRWMEPLTENPSLGTTEVWEIYNATEDAHPIHVHEVVFEVVNRQAITVDMMANTVQVTPGSVPVLPNPWESGFKDTVITYPGEVTRIRAQFVNPGQFVWHCHIIEHEDNEMMRPYRVGPMQDGQPGSMLMP
ncbi:MAG TPA: multicopper oxidase [Gammaproteobacteria bacterium]